MLYIIFNHIVYVHCPSLVKLNLSQGEFNTVSPRRRLNVNEPICGKDYFKQEQVQTNTIEKQQECIDLVKIEFIA